MPPSRYQQDNLRHWKVIGSCIRQLTAAAVAAATKSVPHSMIEWSTLSVVKRGLAMETEMNVLGNYALEPSPPFPAEVGG